MKIIQRRRRIKLMRKKLPSRWPKTVLMKNTQSHLFSEIDRYQCAECFDSTEIPKIGLRGFFYVGKIYFKKLWLKQQKARLTAGRDEMIFLCQGHILFQYPTFYLNYLHSFSAGFGLLGFASVINLYPLRLLSPCSIYATYIAYTHFFYIRHSLHASTQS